MTQVESVKDLTNDKGDQALVDIWKQELEAAEKNKHESKWRKEAQEYFDVYDNQAANKERYPIFWSNTQTLKPLLFSKLPNPNITQRFPDDDDTARIASEMMERTIDLYLKDADAETIISKSRDDYLIGGRGVARVVYDPEEVIEIDGGEVIDPSEKKCRIEYVDWKDFRMSTEKEWSKVRWIAFRHYKNKDELKEDFGSKANGVELNATKEDCEGDLFKVAEVWEIWDKESRKVVFLSGTTLLANEEDPYNLRGFFPMPCPLGSSSNPQRLTPSPLYRQYKAQAEELNKIDVRIKSLVEQCKANGVYSSIAEASDMESLFNGEDGSFTPMTSTGGMSSIKDVVMFKPLGEIIATIASLNDRKDRVIFSIRDITGISDIVRGVTQASETATAQQLKGNFAISRIQPLQKEVEYWVRDLIRLLVELTVENYTVAELAKMTNLKLVDIKSIEATEKARLDSILNELKKLTDPNNPEQVTKLQQANEQAKADFEKTMQKPLEDLKGYAITPEQLSVLDKMIKDDKLRTFAINVETDSTIRVDQQQEKQERVEYIRAISEFSNSFYPLVQSGVISEEAFNNFLMFISKPFKVGRTVEKSLFTKVEKQPSAQEMLAQAQVQIEQQKLQLEAEKIQTDAALKQQELDIKKAQVLQDGQQFQDKLDFEDSNKAADREHATLSQVVSARTEALNDQIRNSNQSTII